LSSKFLLHFGKVLAIVPPLSLTGEQVELDKPIPVAPVARWWVRITLVVIALGMVVVFGVALWLNPYKDGRVWNQGTHTQMGLPECSFQKWTKDATGWDEGIPCPSCGMTTSFALFVRGDIWHSLCANCAGTLLALFCLLYIPWACISAFRGRPLGILSMEDVLVRLIVILVGLMLVRWAIVLIVLWTNSGSS
jgi:hypothetical protein